MQLKSFHDAIISYIREKSPMFTERLERASIHIGAQASYKQQEQQR
jgi:hypothetical protein